MHVYFFLILCFQKYTVPSQHIKQVYNESSFLCFDKKLLSCFILWVLIQSLYDNALSLFYFSLSHFSVTQSKPNEIYSKLLRRSYTFMLAPWHVSCCAAVFAVAAILSLVWVDHPEWWNLEKIVKEKSLFHWDTDRWHE